MVLLEAWVTAAANWIWGPPLLFLVTGGGLFFLLYSRFLPLVHFGHGLSVIAGRHDKPDDPGQISHYQALSVALAATIGMGNIAGVAVAISFGGPGAVFWMWISAIVGMATKYFTCSLAVMYRGRDSAGEVQGGPMYVIVEGLGRGWKPLAQLFCVAGLFGCLPIFNVNQLTQAVADIVLMPAGISDDMVSDAAVGATFFTLAAIVMLGGLTRIAHVAAGLVPFMVVFYFVAVIGVLLVNAEAVPTYLALIFTDAFAADFYKGEAMMGGALGGLIILGARRAAFSNEAGIGTAPMAHGAAKTSEPVHEGLVAMIGPVIDTLIVCTLTALAILVTDVWRTSGADGVTLTANAFAAAYPGFGQYILLVCILSFGLSSLFSYSYFGAKCFSFLFGAENRGLYNGMYLASILFAAVSSMSLIVNFVDFMFALMAIPTMVSAVLLSPKVVAETKRYFAVRRARENRGAPA